MIKARSVLFDLDGTLLDTAPDLVAALNSVLRAHGQAEKKLHDARPFVSRGARGLLQCGFGLDESSDRYPALVDEFLHFYRHNLCRDSSLFEGMADVLDRLDMGRHRWGVVTNKMASLTEPLLKQMDLYDRLHVLVSGDTLSEKKPSPKPLLYACGMADILPEETIYVGDDPRDIQSAQAAGMPSVAARYGYYDKSENLDLWGADWIIDHPSELIDCIQFS